MLIVPAAGPAVSVGMGYLSLTLAVIVPVRMIWKHLLAFFGAVEVFHTLIGYPLIDLTSGLEGDFDSIYGALPAPETLLAVAVHGGLLGVFVLAWNNPPTKKLLVGSSRDH